MNKELGKWEIISVGPVSLRWAENRKQKDLLERYSGVVDRIWQAKQEQSRGRLFNGSVLCWTGISQQNKGALITGYFTEYKYFLAAKVRPDLPMSIYPVAVSGISFLTDKNSRYAIVARRSREVSSYPGFLEFVPSGSIDRQYASNDGMVDFQKQLYSEFSEETGLSNDCIKEVTPFACIFDEQDGVYDVCSRIIVNGSKEDVLEKIARSREYSDPVMVAEDDLSSFVASHRSTMIPSSLALQEAYITAIKAGNVFDDNRGGNH